MESKGALCGGRAVTPQSYGRKKTRVTRRNRGRRMPTVHFMYPKKDGILLPASSAIALTMKLGPLPI